MEKIRHRCEAAVHDRRCNGWADTVDHFTAKAIALIIGWTQEQINARENIQHLNIHCHTLKDRTTPARTKLALKQAQGGNVSQNDYQYTLRKYDGYIDIPEE